MEPIYPPINTNWWIVLDRVDIIREKGTGLSNRTGYLSLRRVPDRDDVRCCRIDAVQCAPAASGEDFTVNIRS